MKLSLLTPAFLFIIFQGAAQGPTLTSANSAIKIGDVFTNQSAFTAGVGFGTSGSNQVWDYSNLVDSPEVVTYTALDPAGTPYADSFPGTNLAVFSANPDTVYQYFKSTSTFLQVLGAVTSGLTIEYIKPRIVLPYPFLYGSFYTDTVIQSIPTRIEVFRGRDSVSGEGYGTLLLPGKTYTNVLRIQYIDNITTVQSIIPGFSDTIHLRTVSYLYLTPGIDPPLLNISQSVVNNSLAGRIVSNDVYYLKSSSLPLKFLSFNAALNNRQVMLQWQTAHETNTGVFNIQRSVTGNDFTTIGQVSASGNTAGGHYTFTDKDFEKAGAPVAYYRIEERDRDGKYFYSAINTVRMPATSSHVYPNPARNVINLDMREGTFADEVTIYDMKGGLMKQLNNYPANKPINISNLSAGSYTVRVKIKGVTTTTNVVKQ